MQKTIVTKIDDVTGKAYDKGETIAFSFEGKDYEIDLNTFNAHNFRRAMGKWVKNARKRTGPARVDGRRVRVQHAEDASAVRSWAQENDYEVGSRGRIPEAVWEAYRAANA